MSLAATLAALLLTSGCGAQPKDTRATTVPGLQQAVTADEYEAAVEGTRKCMLNKGYDVSPAMQGTAGILLSFSWEAVDGASEAYDACYEEIHLKEIEHYWFHSNVPTGSNREEMFEEFTSCLEEGGAAYPDIESDKTLAEVIDLVLEHVDDQSEEFGQTLSCIDDFRLLYPDGVAPL
ncbi:MAG: hypothetical protein LBJ08_04850 [Bifidobacteriaceae bacterium]|jgi:hypothetical protein|nr:hypothetical protein [Bifidobacteriaceae bacterium]